MGVVGVEPTTYDLKDRYSKPAELHALIIEEINLFYFIKLINITYYLHRKIQ